MTRRQVFVSGTWREDIPGQYRSAARAVGKLLAEAGVDMACGPGTGIAQYAIAGFRSVAGRSGQVRNYLPARHHMHAVGETPAVGADVALVETDFDYPMRNVFQVSQCHGLIALTGGDGTLGEIVPALSDYRLPVAVLAGSGPAAGALSGLLDWFPEWRPLVLLADDPAELVRFVLDRLGG